MLSLLLFLIVIGVLVFVHESGHFIAAKLSGIQVDEFALGFGPKVVSYKYGETDYRINLLPFGGYVKMAGEADYENEEAKLNPRGFEVQSAWKKLIVILAGVTMNVVLASVIYTIFMVQQGYSQYVPALVPNNFPFGTQTQAIEFAVDSTDKTSPIYSYHLNDTYILNSINGKAVTTVQDIQKSISQNEGKSISMAFTSTTNNSKQTINVVPRKDPPKGKGSLGIVLSPVVKLSFTGIEKPFSGVLYSFDMLQYNVVAIVSLGREAIRTHTASYLTSNLTGPVGIYEVTGAVYQQAGITGILNIIALLSLALAFMNVLPLPVLDGGYAFIIIIEAIARRELSPKVKSAINNTGIAMLLLLMVFVTVNDINNFNIIGQILHFFKK